VTAEDEGLGEHLGATKIKKMAGVQMKSLIE
jgi:hypothetical protein